MIRWHYPGKTVFGVGLSLALLALLTIVLSSLVQAPPSTDSGGAARVLDGSFIVRDPRSPSLPEALYGPGPKSGGQEHAIARPLATADRAARELRAEPAVAAVFPFSAARLILKGDLPQLTAIGEMTLMGVFPDSEAYFRGRIPGAANDIFRSDLLMPNSYLAAVRAALPQVVAADPILFSDVPGARDRFNLTPVRSTRGYGTNNRSGSRSAPLCFAGASFFWRCTRESLLPLNGNDSATSPLPFAGREGPLIVPGPPMPAPDYPVLFSLRLPDEPGGKPTIPAPAYLLIQLKPGRRAEAAALKPSLERRLRLQNIPAGIDLLDPAALPAGNAPLARALPWLVAGLLSLIVLLANLVFRPVPRPGALAPGPERPGFRPAFVSRSFFIALTFTAVGVLWGLALIPLYNFLAPEEMRQTLSLALGASLDRLDVPPAGLAAAAGFIIVFTLFSLPGPLVRAGLIRKRLAAERSPLPKKNPGAEPGFNSEQ